MNDPTALARALYDAQGQALAAMFPGVDDDRPTFDLLDPQGRTLRVETAAALLAAGWRVIPPAQGGR